MIKSMTGFGRGENSDNIRSFTVEIKSVNHRYKDIVIHMPKHLNYLEEGIKKLIKERIKRGRIEVYINLEYIGDSELNVNVDLSLAQSYKNALELLGDKLNIKGDVTLKLLTKYPDIIKTEKVKENEDEVWEILKIALVDSLDKMLYMRIEEGEELYKNIFKKSEKIEQLVKDIEKRSPEVIIEYKEKLWNKIDELLEDKYELDEDRLANEVAYYSDKASIDEEIVRLNSHINQLRDTLKSDSSVGRKLDFLVQEMNREVNTIGSKAGDISITNNVVELKTEIEKIREQIQNIE